MAKGLRIPLGVNENGSASTLDGELQARQIIMTALSELDNDNAFQQDLGLGSDFLFNMPGNAFRAVIKQRINRTFQRFERLQLFKLIRSSIRFITDNKSGEHTVSFRYINLESDEEDTFSRQFISRGG